MDPANAADPALIPAGTHETQTFELYHSVNPAKASSFRPHKGTMDLTPCHHYETERSTTERMVVSAFVAWEDVVKKGEMT